MRAKPSANLLEKIMRRIDKERRILTLKRRLFIFSFISISSAVSFVPVFRIAQNAILESGFTQFISLIFSDSGAVFMNLRSFAFALLESFPAISVGAFFGILFLFLISIYLIAKDIQNYGFQQIISL